MTCDDLDDLDVLSDNLFVKLCNEVYAYWINGDGVIKDGTNLREYFINHEAKYHDMYALVDAILDEAMKRYESVAKLLMLKRSYMFIKR